MFIQDPGYLEQLTRWGLGDAPAAVAFPAQIGPPPSVPAWQRVAGGGNDSCYRLAGGPDEPPWRFRTLFLKQFRFDPPTWRYLLRRSRATCEAANLRRLDRLGIPCPKVVAVGELRQPGGRLTRWSFLLLAAGLALGLLTLMAALALGWFAGPRMGSIISHAVAGVVDEMYHAGTVVSLACGGGLALGALVAGALRLLNRDYFVGAALIVTGIEPSQDLWRFAHARWRKAGPSDEQRAQVRCLSRQLAAQLAAAHRARFVHHDMKFRNLLACWPKGDSPAADNLRTVWIDCPRGRWTAPGPWLTHGRAKDLAGLDRNAAGFLSRTERLRFLNDYLRALGGEAALAGRRALIGRVLAYHRRRAGDST